jgi:3-oxoacyl-[acyl-carrier protein] reductase
MEILAGKIALVTGGNRGIGAACSLALAKTGCDVAVNFNVRAEEAEKTCAEIRRLGHRALAVQADVAQSEQVKKMVALTEKELGPVSILVNNAGMIRPQKPEEITEADWDEHIIVNLKSAFLVTQAVLPKMREQRWGRIINISSVAAQIGGLVGPHYAAAKAGMLGMMRAYAQVLAKEGVTANAVAPALIDTEMVRMNPRATPTLIPVGRFGSAEEVASVVVMLAENAYITGQTINVNGGWYMS